MKVKARRVNRNRWVLLGVAVLIVITAVAAGYVFYLDYVVQAKFEGKRWAVPARVYARPLEVFPGMRIKPEHLAQEVSLLHYRNSSHLDTPGSFVRAGGAIQLATRSFNFWDGTEPARRVAVVFDGDRVAEVVDIERGKTLELLRLEPLLIGGLYPAHNEDRILVKLDQVPPLLIKALLAIEDRDFYSHHGVSLSSIFRAVLANVRAGGTVQGGSTLTQQLVKNFYLSNERSLSRKLNEAVMALELEWHYRKDEILEAYLNEIYLGQDGNRAIHGFGLASQFYFERPLSELKPEHIALLVALVKGASYYDPRRFPQRAKGRRDLVLDVMAAQGLITPNQAKKARQRALDVVPHSVSGVTRYPAFLDLIRRQLRRDYRDQDLTSEGLRIFTTLDPVAQTAAERAVAERLNAIERARGLKQGTLEGAVVMTGSESGEILALVGGRQPRFAGFNRALDADRHIGSLVKPAVVLTALAHADQYTLATLIEDQPLALTGSNGEVWAPHNYDMQSHGQVPLYAALSNSYNLATVRLGMALGVERVIETLHRLGIERDLKPYPSLFLGASPLTPLEVTQMYQTLASGGFRTPLKAIREVTTASGEPLQRYALTMEQVFEPSQVYLTTRAMQEVVRSGTARAVSQILPVELAAAGKTGTTDDARDSWFAGFTGDRLAVVWVGNDQNRSVGLTGASGALPIWGDIMARVSVTSLAPTLPPEIEYEWIDPATGLRADEGCAERIELPFVAGSRPSDLAPCYSGANDNLIDRTIDWIRDFVP